MQKPVFKTIALLFAILIASLIFPIKSIAQTIKNPAIIAYYHGSTDDVDKYPVEKLSHIIYCFLHLNGNVLQDNENDSIAILRLSELKKRNPSLKVILSLGGWAGCKTCPEVFSTEMGRIEFATSAVKILRKYKADGLDLDWEYPAIASVPGFPYSENDKQNFTYLIETLRKYFGTYYELSFAAGGFTEYLQKSIEWDKVMPLVDYVNLMTYDLVNGYSQNTGHLTSLYSTDFQPESTDNVIKYLSNIGVPKQKLIIGAAFYARVFSEVENTDNGLYRPGKFKSYIAYKDFETHFSDSLGYETFWDNESSAPWSYNKNEKLFATYDNKKSISLKAEYVIKNNLGGIMFWSLNCDTYENGLLGVIFDQFYSSR